MSSASLTFVSLSRMVEDAGRAGLKRASLSLNAAQCHGRALALHNACEGPGSQLLLMAFFFFQFQVKIVGITPSGGSNWPSLGLNEPRHLCGKQVGNRKHVQTDVWKCLCPCRELD